jgi:thioredoxin-related protein
MKTFFTMFLLGMISLTITVFAADNDNSPYFVDTYDPKRNADDDLKSAIDKARMSGKRILLQVGGEWCSWCHLMSKYFIENDTVTRALRKGFVVVKVNYSDENENKDFLSKYPKVKGYPHLYVLDSDGKLLHSQGTSELEEGNGYNESKVMAFLTKWTRQ